MQASIRLKIHGIFSNFIEFEFIFIDKIFKLDVKANTNESARQRA
jgi:hypothetical protein